MRASKPVELYAQAEDVDSSAQFFHPGFWQPFGGNKFTKVNDLTVPTRRGFGSSCWLGSIRRPRLMVMGGGWPATSSTNVIDLDSSSSPKYKAGPSLRAAKVYVSCVQLPDGSVLELGGGSANKIGNASQEVSLLETPTSKSWTAMNPLPPGEHRLYHSMAFLADDGSVISLSSNPKGQARSDTVLQFKPPYTFKTPRPDHRRAAEQDHLRGDVPDRCQQRRHQSHHDEPRLSDAQLRRESAGDPAAVGGRQDHDQCHLKPRTARLLQALRDQCQRRCLHCEVDQTELAHAWFRRVED